MAIVKRTRKPKSESAAKLKEAPAVAKASSRVDVSDIVRFRAYELYLQRGCKHGHDFEDWLRAESEIKSQSSVA